MCGANNTECGNTFTQYLDETEYCPGQARQHSPHNASDNQQSPQWLATQLFESGDMIFGVDQFGHKVPIYHGVSLSSEAGKKGILLHSASSF